MYDGDLTAKARIRNAAIELHAAKGEANTTVREVAEAAGVTHGLVVHHFGSKAGLRRAVEARLLDLLRETLDATPVDGSPEEVGRRRDESVARMYAEHPEFVAYLRRALLDPHHGESELPGAIADFTLGQVRALRAAGVATSTAPEAEQALAIMMRELGSRLLQPLVAQFWDHLTDGDAAAGPPPEIEVRLRRR